MGGAFSEFRPDDILALLKSSHPTNRGAIQRSHPYSFNVIDVGPDYLFAHRVPGQRTVLRKILVDKGGAILEASDKALIERSLLFRESIINELDSWEKEACRDDWDGNGGRAALEESRHHVESFLRQYSGPYSVTPEVEVDADGEYSLEWRRDEAVLRLSFSEGGQVAYAGRNKNRRVKGVAAIGSDDVILIRCILISLGL